MSESAWSVPETEVLDSIGHYLRTGDPVVLATVMDVEGSAYRRPGAKMVLPREGEGIGSITAGCLEDEVLELSQSVLEEGSRRVKTFDLMADHDVWGLGLGCNGVIDILLEPLRDDYRPVVEAYQRGADTAVITVVEGGDVEPLSRAYFDAGERRWLVSSECPGALLEELTGTVESLLERARSRTVEVETSRGPVKVFVDSVCAPPELVVFGHGHDVGPVVEFGTRNDFRVTVVGFRGGEDLAETFPEADRTLSTQPAAVREELAFDADTYPVIMTHNYVDDRLLLGELLETSVPYIGLMGPHDRFQEMLEDFREEGRELDPDDLENVYTPIGLNLGGGSPYQIAHSIIAEVLAVSNGRDPIHLREREGSIHERLEPDPTKDSSKSLTPSS